VSDCVRVCVHIYTYINVCVCVRATHKLEVEVSDCVRVCVHIYTYINVCVCVCVCYPQTGGS